MTARIAALLALCVTLPVAAHVGSPDVFYEGPAGPWTVRVIVRPPGVVPGLAEISVRVEEPGVEAVRVRPVRWDVGLEGAPRADRAVPVRGDDSLYSSELWLMTAGSYSVHVTVAGEAGEGTAVVPVQSVATRRLEMSPALTWILAALGILLVGGAVRIAGAAVESTVPPGEEAGAPERRRARVAMAVALAVVALALYGGRTWWSTIDGAHLKSLYTGFSSRAAVADRDGWRVLELTVDDERWPREPPLAPDHGKLMHMFLIRAGLDAFAHLHPVRQDDRRFAVALPPLPAGEYHVYADVTHENGFARTLTATVELPPPAAAPGSPPGRDGPAGLDPDPDDSWHVGVPASAERYVFDNGFVIARAGAGGPLAVGRETDLTFALRDATGAPAPLEPYMGMTGHAAVRRHDGAVFVHLHPTGTVSMAAKALFETRTTGGDSAGHAGHAMAMDHATYGLAVDSASMPYEFPRAGPYRIWVQLKSGGKVYTGVFDVEVGD